MPFQRKLRLLVGRHAESVLNYLRPNFCFDNADQQAEAREALGGVIRDSEVTLTGGGWIQANDMARRLDRLTQQVAASYCSPYRRTRQTFEGLLNGLRACGSELVLPEPRLDIRLRERNAGATGVMTREEVNACFPWSARYWNDAGPFYGKNPDGESLAETEDRYIAFESDLLASGVEGDVYIQTHGNFMRTIQCRSLGDDPREILAAVREPVLNCAIWVYEWDNTRQLFTRVGKH